MNALLCRAYCSALLLGASLLFAGEFFHPPQAAAQPAEDLTNIQAAEEQHRPPMQSGALWAHLAVEYQGAGDFLKAEDAYNRSLHLTKDIPAAMPLYAATLDNLATLYLTYGRVQEAKDLRKRALTVRQKLGDQAGIGVSEEHVADVAFAEHQYKKAETLALVAIKDMSSAAEPPPIAMLSALITVAYASCLRGHGEHGLAYAEQAYAYANLHFPENSLAVGFAVQTLGFARWKAGDYDGGGKSMQVGLKILRANLQPSDPRLAGALMQYESYLRSARRRPEADEVQDELSRLRTRSGAPCATCTVSVYSLAKGLR